MTDTPQDWTLELETVALMLLRGANVWQVAQANQLTEDDAAQLIAQVRALWKRDADRPTDTVQDQSLAHLRRIQGQALNRYEDSKDPRDLRIALDAGEQIAALRQELDHRRGEHRQGGWKDSYSKGTARAEGTGPERGNSVFSAPGEAPSQRVSRAARKIFEAHADAPWMSDYWALRLEGWPWRHAAYIAWASAPTKGRWPETQARLAAEVLGLKSDRVIRTWRQKNPDIDKRVEILQAAPLMRYRRDVIEALVTVASRAEPSAHQDRKLFLEMTQDYRPRGAIELMGEGGGPVKTQDVVPNLSAFSDDELDQLAEFAQRFAGDQPGESAAQS